MDWLELGTRTFKQILRLENEQKVCKVQAVKGVGATDKEFPLTYRGFVVVVANYYKY